MPASEERSLHEFPSAMSILATTLLWVSTVAPSSTSGYDSEKTTAIDLASAILGDFEYTQDLATNVKTIFGAINSIMVLSGTTVPSSAIGANGQLYVKYTSSGGVDTVDGLYWKIDNDWVEISTGGGGGGATVTLGTTVPSDASGSNGDLYVQYDGTSYAVIEYFVKINGSWRKAPYSRVVALTQAEYDLITPDPTTLYIITDAQSSYQTKTDANLQTTANTVVGAINELKSDKQDEIIPVVLNNNLTYHANCSIQNGFIIRYGRIVEVGMILKATGNINNNDIIVSGLPRALLNRRCPRGLGIDQWFANTDYTSGGLAVDADEQDQTKAIIRNFANITASSSSPKYIYMSFSYVTMN